MSESRNSEAMTRNRLLVGVVMFTLAGPRAAPAVESFTKDPFSPLDVHRLHIRECIFHRGADGERSLTRVFDASERNVCLAGGAMVHVNHSGLNELHNFIHQVPVTREQ